MAAYGLPEDVIAQVMEAITNDTFKASSRVNFEGKSYTLYELFITGTTFSGHPTRTTLGNSLRTLSYVCYIISLALGEDEAIKAFFGKSDRVIVYVAGDDVMIAGEETAIEQIALMLT